MSWVAETLYKFRRSSCGRSPPTPPLSVFHARLPLESHAAELANLHVVGKWGVFTLFNHSLSLGIRLNWQVSDRDSLSQEAAALDPRFKMKWCRTGQEEAAVQGKLEELAQELRISNPSPSSNYCRSDENINDSKVSTS